MPEWQPIETAPDTFDDSTRILGFGDGDLIEGCIYLMYWDKWEKVWIEYYSMAELQPSHWMPSPDLPEGF